MIKIQTSLFRYYVYIILSIINIYYCLIIRQNRVLYVYHTLLLLNRMRHGASLQIIKIFCLEFVIDLFII